MAIHRQNGFQWRDGEFMNPVPVPVLHTGTRYLVPATLKEHRYTVAISYISVHTGTGTTYIIKFIISSP